MYLCGGGEVCAQQGNNPANTNTQPQWPWPYPPWMPPPGAMGQSTQPPATGACQQNPWMPWMMGQSYPNPWIPPPQAAEDGTKVAPQVRPESDARAARRAARKDVESSVNMRRSGGHKPYTLRVKPSGGIDGGCEGKNAFDEALRSMVPRILDVSCLTWKMQNPAAVEKLRAALDNEFEYLDHPLSNVGFKNAVKRQMKTERSKMKGWFMSGRKQCPLFIEPDQWERLCDYWGKPETAQKSQVMAKARQQVKNQSNVGRAGKAGKEALLVRISYNFSDFADVFRLLPNLIFHCKR